MRLATDAGIICIVRYVFSASSAGFNALVTDRRGILCDMAGVVAAIVNS